MAPETADLSVRFSEEQKNNVLVTIKNTYMSCEKLSITFSSLIRMVFLRQKFLLLRIRIFFTTSHMVQVMTQNPRL